MRYLTNEKIVSLLEKGDVEGMALYLKYTKHNKKVLNDLKYNNIKFQSDDDKNHVLLIVGERLQ